ncbi:MAG: hypothetical protein ACLVJ6_00980 [Merdibacter sp.]
MGRSAGRAVVLYYEQMDASLRPAYASLYAGMSAFEAQIVLEGVQEEDVETLFRSVIEDHPRLFYIGSSYRYRLYADGPMVLEPTYAEKNEIDIPADRLDVKRSWLRYRWKRRERAAGLYACVIEQEYARNDRDQQMDGFFLNGKSVCAGYARAYQYLMQKAGFRCTTISGELREGRCPPHPRIAPMPGTWCGWTMTGFTSMRQAAMSYSMVPIPVTSISKCPHRKQASSMKRRSLCRRPQIRPRAISADITFI